MAKTGVFIGEGGGPRRLDLKYANRHGLIAGATGTGKTVTLQILTEGFSKAGVPVFLADVKGDLAGLSRPGDFNEFLVDRAATLGLSPYEPEAFPVCFWDLHGEQGCPIRATVSEMGPLMLSRLLDLNDTQEGVLTLAFRVADDEGLLLLDLKDLRALLIEIAGRTRELSAAYGHVSRASIGAIQRRLLSLKEQGGERFFGEPALDLADFMRTDTSGRGVVNILAADRLMQTPKLYATFLLWLLSELFEELPEVGDPEKPKLVFFFDEAHLLFDDCPDALLDKIEQVVRLIRSKGVGVYFASQNPLDIPDSVSSQLGNRFQHALRAYTPREQRVVRAAAETFRPNEAFRTIDVITELAVGEALVSTLMRKGVPSPVERTLIRPPSSRMGPVTRKERAETMALSEFSQRYGVAVDRASAHEAFRERAERRLADEERERSPSGRSRGRRRQSVGEAALKSAARTFSSTLAREILRGVLGGFRRR